MKDKIVILVLVLLLVFVFFLNYSSFEGINSTNYSDYLERLYSKFKHRFKIINGNSTLSGVDMIYVINMPQRFKYISNEMKKLNVRCTYFDAVKPIDLFKEDYNSLSTINDKGSRIYNKTTRLPLLLSFVMCFMDSLKKGYSTIIIFEDDLKILVDPTTLNIALQEFNESEFDAFYMGYCFLNCGQPVTKYNTLVELSDPNLICCHSICLKTRILPGLIKYCFPMVNNSDEMFRDYYKANKIKVVVPKKIFFTQNRETVPSENQSKKDDELFKVCMF